MGRLFEIAGLPRESPVQPGPLAVADTLPAPPPSDVAANTSTRRDLSWRLQLRSKLCDPFFDPGRYLSILLFSCRRHRVVAGTSPRVTSTDSFYAHPTAGDPSVKLDCFHKILRTGRLKTTSAPRTTRQRGKKRGHSGFIHSK